MSYATIRSAQKSIWPAVTASLERHRRSREAIKHNGEAVTAAAKARARKPWDRVVAEETVWAIAKADLLNTPEQAAVLSAVREWVKSWPTAPTPSFDPDDHPLYMAAQVWLATPTEIPEDML